MGLEKNFIAVNSAATIEKQNTLSLNLWRAAVRRAADRVRLAVAALPAEVAGAAEVLAAVARAVAGKAITAYYRLSLHVGFVIRTL